MNRLNSDWQLHLIFVMGAPRSATTFLATELAKELRLPLFPETQFFERALGNNKPNPYILENWADVDIEEVKKDPRHALARAIASKYFQHYGLLPEPNSKIVFIDHTPQNILVAGDLRKAFPEALMIYCLRWPPLAIASLARQPWYNRGLLRAAAYNFRCICFAIRNLGSIDLIVDIGKAGSVDIALSKVRDLGCDHEVIGDADNWYLNSEDLRASHAYLTRKGRDPDVGYSQYLAAIVSLPSIVAYLFLKFLSRGA